MKNTLKFIVDKRVAFIVIFTFVLTAGLTFVFQDVFAWTNPDQNPPGGTATIRIDDGGNIGIGTNPVSGQKITVSGTLEATTFSGSLDWSDITNRPNLTNAVIQDNGANVGIGTTPSTIYKLDVAGPIQADSYYSSDGTAGSSVTTGGITFKNGLYTAGTMSYSETDPKVGSLTTNYISKWGGSTLTNSLIQDDGTNIGIGIAPGSYKLNVSGYVRGSSGLCIGDDCRSSWPSGGGADGTGGWTDGGSYTYSTGRNVGIGSSAPTYPLHITQSTSGWQVRGVVGFTEYNIGHYSGYGMYIKDFNTSDSLYAMQLNNTTSELFGVYNSGRVCMFGSCRTSWPGGIDGSGTVNYVPKFTAGTTLGSSSIYDNGNVGIGTTGTSNGKLNVSSNGGWAGYFDGGSGSGAYASSNSGGYGLSGYSNYGYGVYGSSSSGLGIYGSSSYGNGIQAYSYGAYGMYTYSGTQYALYAYSGGSYGIYAYGSSGAGYLDGKVYVGGNLGVGRSDPQTKLHIYGSGSVLTRNESTNSNAEFQLVSGGYSGNFNIQSNGNVGIWTTNGSHALVINGSSGNIGINSGGASNDPPDKLSVLSSGNFSLKSSLGGNSPGSIYFRGGYNPDNQVLGKIWADTSGVRSMYLAPGDTTTPTIDISATNGILLRDNVSIAYGAVPPISYVKLYIPDENDPPGYKLLQIGDDGFLTDEDIGGTLGLRQVNSPSSFGYLKAYITSPSSEKYKYAITPLGVSEKNYLLNTLANTELKLYHLNEESETTEKHLGVISEEAPFLIRSRTDALSISSYDYSSLALFGAKEALSQIKELKEIVCSDHPNATVCIK